MSKERVSDILVILAIVIVVCVMIYGFIHY